MNWESLTNLHTTQPKRREDWAKCQRKRGKGTSSKVRPAGRVKAWVGNQVGKARMYDLTPLWQQLVVSSPRGPRPQFLGWEFGSRGVRRVGLSGGGFLPVSDQ